MTLPHPHLPQPQLAHPHLVTLPHPHLVTLPLQVRFGDLHGSAHGRYCSELPIVIVEPDL